MKRNNKSDEVLKGIPKPDPIINKPKYDSFQNEYNMQNSFINCCRHEKMQVKVYLLDKTSEIGQIVGYDNSTLIMSNDSKGQFLIMKSSISKIIPEKVVNYIFNNDYRYLGDYCSEINYNLPSNKQGNPLNNIFPGYDNYNYINT